MLSKSVRQKKCRQCGDSFKPWNSTQIVCSIDCARDYAKLQRATEYRAETRKRRKELNMASKSYVLKKCQETFNKYIKIRDKGQPCISCDKPDNGQHQRHASHYRSVAAQGSLRFHEMNVHTSCAQCNTMKSGNLIEYRIRLVKKIGAEMVDWLEKDHQPQKLSIEEIKEIRAYYKQKIKSLEADNENQSTD